MDILYKYHHIPYWSVEWSELPWINCQVHIPCKMLRSVRNAEQTRAQAVSSVREPAKGLLLTPHLYDQHKCKLLYDMEL